VTDLAVHVDDLRLDASWVDANPETRAALADALPVGGEAARWGDELYVRVPVDAPAEEATATPPVGALAYWPQGDALCLFWGPTPASRAGEPRAASTVTVVAVVDDVSALAGVEGGASLRVERGGDG
jgi:hypothetical protein